MAAEVARQAMFCTGYLPTTATSEWTTFETIGGLQPTADGLIYRPGLFVDAIESGRWLVIDELNRSNFDRAFGQLFTVLSGSAVVLPFKRKGQPRPDLARAAPASSRPEKTDVIRVPANWRIIATMNVFDKNLLFDMSLRPHAPLRLHRGRHPVRRGLREAAPGPGRASSPSCSPCGSSPTSARPSTSTPPSTPPVGPRTGPPSPACIYEVFYAYFLPQFEGMEDRRATTLYRAVAQHLDPPEQAEAQRTIREVLGVELAV